MGDEPLLSIGQFARLTGLTIKALRHYDAVGLLVPAEVDSSSGYRRYTRLQVEDGALVRRLRDVDLPLGEVRRVIDAAARSEARADVLKEHRRRIDARLTHLQRVLHGIDHLIAEGDTAMTFTTDAPAEEQLAKELFNHVWTLLEKESRTADDDAEMVHAAHASCLLWLRVGTPVNAARGEWQCSRVYSVLGLGERALYHAARVLDLCERNGIGDFDLAFAYEALARAHAVSGDVAESARHAELAREASAAIADPEDRDLVLSDLATIPMA